MLPCVRRSYGGGRTGPGVEFQRFRDLADDDGGGALRGLSGPGDGETKPLNLEAGVADDRHPRDLEVKTRGNLTAQERSLLEQVLYDLRMRYVAAQQQAPSGPLIVEP